MFSANRRHQNQKAYFITDSVIIDGFAEKSPWVYVTFWNHHVTGRGVALGLAGWTDDATVF
jgi:hypothetical protein